MPVRVTRPVFYDTGRQACRRGIAREKCPYPAGFDQAAQWLKGWDEMAPLIEAERVANDNQARAEAFRNTHAGTGYSDNFTPRTPWTEDEDEELLALLDPDLKLTYEDIGERLSRPVGSICSHIHAMRQRPGFAERIPPRPPQRTAADFVAEQVVLAIRAYDRRREIEGHDIIHAAVTMPPGWSVDMVADLQRRVGMKYSAYAIGRAIGRPEGEVERVCERMGLEIDAWPVPDRAQLRALLRSKKTTYEIAAIMGRPVDNVRAQAKAMKAQSAERRKKFAPKGTK